ncbi:MAG: acylphosphatase [Ignavibacteria bacterium]|nr:acylphosphatase [Ignavibacteria bacterium]
MKHVKITVKGLVQGVGFRYFCAHKAIELSISGYAKNMYDGSVLIEAEGEDGMVNEFIESVKIGPPLSKVNSINVEELEYEGKFKSFRIY